MKKNIGSIITTLLFLVFIFGMSIGTMAMKDRDFSEVENRNLSSRPKLTMKTLIDGTYGKDLETYSSDQLIFKDTMAKFKNQVLRTTGRTRINNVYLCKENMFIQEYREDTKTLTENLSYIRDWCKGNLDKNHTFVCIAPNASEIYDENLPAADMNQSESVSVSKAVDILGDAATVINPLESIKEHKDEYIYYRTDHHWTMLGAYYGYENAAKHMGITPIFLNDMNQIDVSEKFYGSLYSQAPLMITKPDDMTLYDYKDLKYSVSQLNYKTGEVLTESNSFIVEEDLTKKDKYAALFGGNFGCVKITNSQPNDEAKGKSLLVFKDSYANSIIPYFIGNYESITMIDLRYFDYMTNDISKLGLEGKYSDVLFLYNASFINSDTNFLGLEF